MATKKKKLIGHVNMATGEFKPVKKQTVAQRKRNENLEVARARKSVQTIHKRKDPGVEHRWETLEELCQQLADAQEADSWKGGGDPDAIPVIEAELELAKLKLRTHIDSMRRYYEGDQ